MSAMANLGTTITNVSWLGILFYDGEGYIPML